MDKKNPLLSIVTPSFNQAQFLETTIRSVLEQDYPSFEYIIIDGGSTDGSVDIIRRYADRLTYWQTQTDRGQADAINEGLRRAKGEYVAWINSDDVYMPGAFREAMRAFIDHPEAGMVYGDGIMVNQELELLDKHYYRQLNLVDLLAFEVLLQPAVFMRKTALEEVGYLNDQYNLILDHELWVRIASAFPIKHIRSFWALERTHPMAKTIALAGRFVEEAERLIADSDQSDVTCMVIQDNHRRIYAGLNVFAARRLIDAGEFGVALRRISRAALQHPYTVLRYWYKWVQAAFSAIGFAPLFMWYRSIRRRLTYGKQRVDFLRNN
jgi:glycosyltransferase involved in cell wall biosynthesis